MQWRRGAHGGHGARVRQHVEAASASGSAFVWAAIPALAPRWIRGRAETRPALVLQVCAGIVNEEIFKGSGAALWYYSSCTPPPHRVL
jgi:hypothetical protein